MVEFQTKESRITLLLENRWAKISRARKKNLLKIMLAMHSSKITFLFSSYWKRFEKKDSINSLIFYNRFRQVCLMYVYVGIQCRVVWYCVWFTVISYMIWRIWSLCSIRNTCTSCSSMTKDQKIQQSTTVSDFLTTTSLHIYHHTYYLTMKILYLICMNVSIYITRNIDICFVCEKLKEVIL